MSTTQSTGDRPCLGTSYLEAVHNFSAAGSISGRTAESAQSFQQKWVVSKQMSSDGNTFEGIKLVCDQLPPVADAAAAVVPPAMISVNRNGPDVVYNTSNGKVTRQTSDPLEQVYARTTYPMNLNRGEIIYDFEYAVDLTSIDHNNAFGIGRDYQPQKYVRWCFYFLP